MGWLEFVIIALENFRELPLGMGESKERFLVNGVPYVKNLARHFNVSTKLAAGESGMGWVPSATGRGSRLVPVSSLPLSFYHQCRLFLVFLGLGLERQDL